VRTVSNPFIHDAIPGRLQATDNPEIKYTCPFVDRFIGELVVKKLSKLSLAKRLSFFQVVVILFVMGIFSFTLSTLITKRIEKRTESDLKQQVTLLAGMMSTYNSALVDDASKLSSVYCCRYFGLGPFR
jgi:hypothetical protein